MEKFRTSILMIILSIRDFKLFVTHYNLIISVKPKVVCNDTHVVKIEVFSIPLHLEMVGSSLDSEFFRKLFLNLHTVTLQFHLRISPIDIVTTVFCVSKLFLYSLFKDLRRIHKKNYFFQLLSIRDTIYRVLVNDIDMIISYTIFLLSYRVI
ncbi:hypothetical protein V1478_011638 [Vespula squamosa]|uniref:Uncharacterized protein n=1 Tax=Vespula squamosa TaxID=30214 RepID=A0ABD2AF45_VESSQ